MKATLTALSLTVLALLAALVALVGINHQLGRLVESARAETAAARADADQWRRLQQFEADLAQQIARRLDACARGERR